ncbi:chorismate synthase, partial [mine drainage metagenome]
MSFTFKDGISLSIFGSSHGPYVGFTLSGIPAGEEISEDEINKWMKRRAPGQSILTTQRKEDDHAEIISGIKQGYSDGGAVTILIKNTDIISKNYEELRDKPRPGHGDISLYYKYGEFRNFEGGGFLSGRMTTCLTGAGAIIINILKKKGIEIVSYIDRMGNIALDRDITPEDSEVYSRDSRIPDTESDRKASEFIKNLLHEGNSTGACIRTIVKDCPPGIGEPFFDSFESVLSHL